MAGTRPAADPAMTIKRAFDYSSTTWFVYRTAVRESRHPAALWTRLRGS